ncbi:MAG: MarR family transcriptional regulator [Alphaproteobacteria bacterium]|nr:MarR family transcriptional regulator [Alphaproteobacteria bacterium]
MADIELALLIDRLMRRIHFGLQEKASRFDRENIGPGGGIILLNLADMECCGIQELTNRVARDKSQMTRTIRSLEAKGLVERRLSRDDARVSLVSVTTKGDRVVEELRQALAETINDILNPMSAQEKQDLKNLVKRAVD